MDLDPESEVLTLIGSKEGIAHLPLGINDPEDINLMTSPGYPVYQMGTLFAGGYCQFLPLTRETGFLPDLKAIPPLVARDAKAFFFNYPNNPTAAVADKDFFARVVDFCREYKIIAVHDAAYTELAFDGFKPPSFLEVARGQRDRHRVSFPLQDLQHDRLAPGHGGGEPAEVLAPWARSRATSTPGSSMPFRLPASPPSIRTRAASGKIAPFSRNAGTCWWAA